MLAGKLWPNGEFGVAIRPKNVKVGLAPIPKLSEFKQFVLKCLRVHGVEKTLAEFGESPKDSGFISACYLSHRAERGSRGITKAGQRKVRNAAFVMERGVRDKSLLSFVTLTVPSLSVEEWSELSRLWPEVVRVLVQSVRRRLKRRSLPAEVIAVTEIQERRFLKSGELGYHLHLVFQGRSKGKSWAINTREMDEIWLRVLKGKIPTVQDVKSACQMVPVKKSVSSYLGKYMSKGVAVLVAVKEKWPEIRLPPAWYSMTTTLLKRVMTMVRSGADVLNWLWNATSEKLKSVVKFAGSVYLKTGDGREVEIARFGSLAEKWREFWCWSGVPAEVMQS